MAKTEYPDGVSTYRGVVFVREDSPIQALPQLRGQSIAMVRTTMAGNLYPVWLLARNDLLAAAKGHFRWVGTHDEVIRRVLDGSVAVGAVKDLRLAAYLAQNPSARVRQLAVSAPVPENALILRGDLSEEMTRRLEKAIRAMHQTDAGRAALAAFGAARFLPCDLRDYRALYQMVEDLGPDWREVGVAGDPPHWPETSPQTAPAD